MKGHGCPRCSLLAAGGRHSRVRTSRTRSWSSMTVAGTRHAPRDATAAAKHASIRFPQSSKHVSSTDTSHAALKGATHRSPRTTAPALAMAWGREGVIRAWEVVRHAAARRRRGGLIALEKRLPNGLGDLLPPLCSPPRLPVGHAREVRCHVHPDGWQWWAVLEVGGDS